VSTACGTRPRGTLPDAPTSSGMGTRAGVGKGSSHPSALATRRSRRNHTTARLGMHPLRVAVRLRLRLGAGGLPMGW
jgi:hypothetical protein